MDKDLPDISPAAPEHAAAARPGAARRLVQPWWLHLMRGSLVAGMCLAKVVPGFGWIRLCVVLVLVAAFFAVETWAERRRGLAATSAEALRSYPGRRWSMLLLVAVGVLVTEYVVARGLPLVVQLLPAMVILLAWTWFGIRADRQQARLARDGVES